METTEIEKIKIEEKGEKCWVVALVKMIALKGGNNSQIALVYIKSGLEFDMH